jgi:hypothetical protein
MRSCEGDSEAEQSSSVSYVQILLTGLGFGWQVRTCLHCYRHKQTADIRATPPTVRLPSSTHRCSHSNSYKDIPASPSLHCSTTLAIFPSTRHSAPISYFTTAVTSITTPSCRAAVRSMPGVQRRLSASVKCRSQPRSNAGAATKTSSIPDSPRNSSPISVTTSRRRVRCVQSTASHAPASRWSRLSASCAARQRAWRSLRRASAPNQTARYVHQLNYRARD